MAVEDVRKSPDTRSFSLSPDATPVMCLRISAPTTGSPLDHIRTLRRLLHNDGWARVGGLQLSGDAIMHPLPRCLAKEGKPLPKPGGIPIRTLQLDRKRVRHSDNARGLELHGTTGSSQTLGRPARRLMLRSLSQSRVRRAYRQHLPGHVPLMSSGELSLRRVACVVMDIKCHRLAPFLDKHTSSTSSDPGSDLPQRVYACIRCYI